MQQMMKITGKSPQIPMPAFERLRDKSANRR